MSGDWQTVTEAEVDATPDRVWQAIATGPGLNGWFAGTNAVQPGSGGTLRSTMSGYTDELSVTAWEPLQRVTYRSSQSDDAGSTRSSGSSKAAPAGRCCAAWPAASCRATTGRRSSSR